MKKKLDILRRKTANDKPYHQVIEYETADDNATIATALLDINNRSDIKDINGNNVEKIIYQHSCLQRKCGACAMVINNHPALACDSFLKDYKTDTITIEPLRKFPVVADLMVDRSILFKNLDVIGEFLNSQADISDKNYENAYEASRCLQCGLCLEVCPNFYEGAKFSGTASFVPTARLLNITDSRDFKRLKKAYISHIYEGCGKSLACHDICPAKIPIEKLLTSTNAMTIWKRRRK